ncbi:testis-specific serine/threonine-protein kinase 4-like [Argonauta hians]
MICDLTNRASVKKHQNLQPKFVDPNGTDSRRKERDKYNCTSSREVLSRYNYTVLKTLGYGSFSIVRLARHRCYKPDLVAIKIIRLSKVPVTYQNHFLSRELEFWPKLNHPHIIKFYDSFEELERVYIVLEYASNGDMMSYIQKFGALPEAKSKKYISQVCGAVAYLHGLNITHRDLKLENLLLDQNNNIKITDFGFVTGNKLSELSQTYCGTKSYASPEILRGEPYDPRKADTWAIGVILYIMGTCRMPFDESRGIKRILEDQKRLCLTWGKTHRISRDCRHLIKRLFTYTYIMRPSVKDILLYKWFHTDINKEKQTEHRKKKELPVECDGKDNQEEVKNTKENILAEQDKRE